MADEKDAKAQPFQDGLAALETLVARLESGDLPLEEALRAFEEGVGLVRVLNQKLTEAEHRIEVLSRGDDGALRLREEPDDES